MLDISVYQDRSGFWAWEVLDEEGVYIRSCQSFVHEHDAREDLKVCTCLIHEHLNLN